MATNSALQLLDDREMAEDKSKTHLSSLLLGHVEGLCELGKAVIDGCLLQASPISGQPLVQWNGVPLGILPITDAGRDLPVLLLLGANCSGRRVHHGHRGRSC